MAQWKRSENIPFPSTWRTFKRQHQNVEKTFWIQDFTDEYEEEFLNFMKGYLRDEVICKSLKITEDSQLIDQFITIWRVIVKDRLSIICFTKNEAGNNVIVGGILFFGASQSTNFDINIFSDKIRRFISGCQYVRKLKDVFTEFNVDSYLVAGGLYVSPKYRRLGIAVEMLKTGREISAAVGFHISASIFSSPLSQKSAAEAGFKDFNVLTYEELKKLRPDEWDFPGITENSKFIKCMYIDYRQTN